MSYEWITPKTDWTTTTRFEYTDYNRIRNNLLYINDMLNELYPDKAQTLDLGDAKTGYANEYAVSEFNAFEEALESFTRIGQDVNVGDRNYYRGNNSFIWADALNRLEQCCLRWKDVSIVKATSIRLLLPKTEFTYKETCEINVEVLPNNATHKNDYTLQHEGVGAIMSYYVPKRFNAGEESGLAKITASVDNVSDVSNIKVMIFMNYFGSGAVVYNGSIYSFSGYPNYTDFVKWNGTAWENAGTLPVKMNTFKVVVFNNEIHLIGGEDGITHYYNQHYKLNGNSWQKLTNMPFYWRVPCCVVYNNEIHLLGGQWMEQDTHSSKTNKHYKWNGTTWSEVSTLPDDFKPADARNNSIVVFNNEIHVINKKHYKWNGTNWSLASNLPKNFYHVNLIVYDNKIHLLGGRVDEDDSSLWGFYHYTWDGTTWIKKEDLMYRKIQCMAVLFNNQIYMFDNNSASNTYDINNAQNMFAIDP